MRILSRLFITMESPQRIILLDQTRERTITMEKKIYVAAEMQFMSVKDEDIITTSLPGISLPDIELTDDDVVKPSSSDITEY